MKADVISCGILDAQIRAELTSPHPMSIGGGYAQGGLPNPPNYGYR